MNSEPEIFEVYHKTEGFLGAYTGLKLLNLIVLPADLNEVAGFLLKVSSEGAAKTAEGLLIVKQCEASRISFKAVEAAENA